MNGIRMKSHCHFSRTSVVMWSWSGKLKCSLKVMTQNLVQNNEICAVGIRKKRRKYNAENLMLILKNLTIE